MHFFGSCGSIFWGLFLYFGSGSKIFLDQSYVDHQFCFESAVGAVFGFEVRFKAIFGTYPCRQSTLFWKYSPIFLFLLGQISGLFSPFGAIFRVVAHLHRQTVFILEV